MPSLGLVKLAVNIVSSLGVMKIVGDVVKNNTVVMTTGQRLVVSTGTFVLSGMLVDQATTFVNNQVDQIIAMHKKEDPDSLNASDDDLPKGEIILDKK